MVDRTLYPHELQCAQRFDGHAYQRQHREYCFTAALETYREYGTWAHLSPQEAMATMSLLAKALQLWSCSQYTDQTQLDEQYAAFHSLYDLLKDVKIPKH